MEGWLRKRGKYHHISSHWNERYFILDHKTLSYYVRRGDMDPKGEFQLFPECRVSEIIVEGKEMKKGHRRGNSTASTTTTTANHGVNRTPDLSLSSSVNKRRHVSLEEQQETKRGILYTFRVIWPATSTATTMTTAEDGGTTTDPDTAEALLVPGTPTGTPERILSHAGSEEEQEKENDDDKGSTIAPTETTVVVPNIRTDHPLPRILTLDSADVVESKSPLLLSPGSLKRSTSSFTRSPFTLRKHIKPKPSATTTTINLGRSLTQELHHPPPPPPPQHVDQHLPAHITSNPISQRTNDDGNNDNKNNYNAKDNMGEEIIEALKAVKKSRNKKKQRKIFASGGVVAATGALVTTTILTGGLSLATLLTVIGISTAAGTSGAIAGRTFLRSKQLQSSTSIVLVLASVSLDDAQQWRNAIIDAIANSGDDDDDDEEDYSINVRTSTHLRLDVVGPTASNGSGTTTITGTWANLFQLGGHNPASALIPNAPASITSSSADDESCTTNLSLHLSSAYAHCGTKWKPVLTGWVSFLGIPTGLRIYEEEKNSHQYTTIAPNPKLQGEKFCQMISVKGRSSPLLKAQIVLDANPVDAFMCLMSYNQIRSPSTHMALCPVSSLWSSFRIVETLDDHTDIIHLVFRPLFLFPSWTSARDYCILRHWRLDDDGSYVMFYEPVKHRECPPAPNYVRGEMHGVYTIAPLKSDVMARQNRYTTTEPDNKTTHHEHSQCLLMHMVQTDPKGWIPTFKVPIFGSQRYSDIFGISSLLQILDVRDSLVNERFVPVSVSEDQGILRGKDENLRRRISEADLNLNSKNVEFGTRHFDDWILRSESLSDESFERRNGDVSPPLNSETRSPPPEASFVIPRSSNSDNETLSDPIQIGAEMVLNTYPDFFLPTTDWEQPDSNFFKVRGKQYLTDKRKVHAGNSIMQLIGVDIVQVPIPERKGLCAHPKEFVQMSLQRENIGGPVAPPFIFAVNILLPGPPHFHLMIYFSVEDKSTIDGSSGTESSLLANKFFFGDSDTFRDVTFKLIPQIVEGNFIVRKAVGSTPAIMGLKLKQYYFSSDRYFELFLDVASSSVAAGVVALTVGYAKTLVVDMAFLLEGAEEWALPEKILGTCRLKKIDLHGGMRFCEPY